MNAPNSGNNVQAYPGLGIWGLISSAAARILRIDPTTHAMRSIDTPHGEVHEAHSFFFQEGFILNNASRDYLIETADTDREPHLVITVIGAQDTYVEFVKRTDHTPGDEVIIQNRNERSVLRPETRIWRDPGGGDGGESQTMWSARFGVPAVGGAKAASGADTSTRQEIVLAKRSGQNIGKYKLRVTALSANDNNITVSFDWYEHTPRD